MAVTQFQQYLADKAQVSADTTECCLAMGGSVDVVNDSCELANQSIPLNIACTVAQQVAENTPDASQQQSGGGLGAWLSENVETLGSIFTDVAVLFGATPPPQTSPGPPPKDNTKTFIAVAVAILMVVVAIFLIRKSRK